jgi:SAM-dependent methyltransferase
MSPNTEVEQHVRHESSTATGRNELRQFYELDGDKRNHWLEKPTEIYVRLDRLRFDLIFQGIAGRYPVAADIGCGSGVVASRLIPISDLTIALDLTSVRLAQVRRSVSAARLLQGDVRSLPIRDGSLDLTVVSEVIEHLPDYRPALSEITRVLRPGGTCVLSVPYLEDVEQQVCPHCHRSFPLHGHLHSFDREKITSALKEVGLSPCRLASLNNTVATKLAKLIAAPYPLLRFLDSVFRRLLPHLNHHLVVFSRKGGASGPRITHPGGAGLESP